jgi:hypothetical protein
MVRLLTAAFAASVTFSAASYAADPQILITVDRDAQFTHRKVIVAAETLCKSAIARDETGEFGSLSECVDNSVKFAHPLKAGNGFGGETLTQSAN